MGFFRKSKKSTAAVSPQPVAAREQWRDQELSRPMDVSRAGQCRYRPLDPQSKEIRLVNVIAGQPSDPMRCSLVYTPLAGATVPFETVSYCWGRATLEKTIEIDGRAVAVTASAAGVLYRMRHPDINRLLWIDAISIRQDDKDDKGEKPHQISLMGSIYSRAWRNLVWLGDDHGNADEAIRVLRSVERDLRSHCRNDRSIWDAVHSAVRQGAVESYVDTDIHLTSLAAFFASNWFSRLWVAQEAALATQSLCHYGPLTIDMTDVLRAAAWLEHSRHLLPISLRKVPSLSKAAMLWALVDRAAVPSRVRDANTRDLYNIYLRTRDLDATVPRDKIYALLGMLQQRSPECSLLLTPVYHGKSDMEVFRDATRAMIEQSGHVKALGLMTCRTAQNSSWPSWVIDFSQDRDIDYEASLLASSYSPDGGESAREVPLGPVIDRNILTLGGIVADVVAEYTGPIDVRRSGPGIWSAKVQRTLATIFKLAQTVSAARTRESSREIGTCLIGGRDWRHFEGERINGDDFAAFLVYFEKHSKPPSPAQWPSMTQYGKETEMAIRYFAKFERTSWSRSFFTTKAGRIGLGPMGLREEDVIAVLFGGQTPFVLRPLRDGRYKFIGECYVHGIMDGQAMQQHRAENRRDIAFEIV
ncbi:unnamed protein product [Zymoseptoria tritici ST99CH_3D7]|uniref:Heterokaryon incompatibility domain-containing protein n=1 Tax=Zymoseptoria tritici (strain ST99CH_3D7) TaxID=1276538 RepID=A0A1X7RM62_ZYMT9|nr:unnamed protein product [Zymoseptoria tritici ST99CH_3D7]